MSAQRLTQELGAELPASVAALPEDALAVLAETLAATRQAQAQALAEANERGLAFLPRLLRGPVQKVLFR